MNTIAKRILSNVQKYPQKTAIVDHDGTRETTWAELLETATQIACHARRQKLSGIVPILQGRTMEYVASILGSNMAGLAVVNLTDTYPEERVNYICEDVGAPACVDNAFVERAMHTLGQLVQHIPVTVSFEAKATVIECMQKMQTDFIESWFYDNYPFELLESKYGISSSIVFVYQGELENGFSMLGHEIPMEFLVPQSIYYNLILCVVKVGNQYGFRVGYNSEAYEKNTIYKLMDTYAQTIQRYLLVTNE